MSRKKTGNGERLKRALSDISPASLRAPSEKNERLNIRVSAQEKAEIEATAKALGMAVSDYLLQLHRHARERL